MPTHRLYSKQHTTHVGLFSRYWDCCVRLWGMEIVEMCWDVKHTLIDWYYSGADIPRSTSQARCPRFFHRVLRVAHAMEGMGLSTDGIAHEMVALIGDYEHLMSWFLPSYHVFWHIMMNLLYKHFIRLLRSAACPTCAQKCCVSLTSYAWPINMRE